MEEDWGIDDLDSLDHLFPPTTLNTLDMLTILSKSGVDFDAI